MTPRIIALTTILGFAASAASAEDVNFTSLDVDVSGGISLAEAQAVAPGLTGDDFAMYDADGSGELSEEEFANWVAASQSR